MKCSECKFWKKAPKDQWAAYGSPIGECHGKTPSPCYLNRAKEFDLLNLLIAWPFTRNTDFCSSFVSAKEPKPEPVKESWWKELLTPSK